LSRLTGTGSMGVVLACMEWTGVAGADVQSGFAGMCAVVIIPGYPIGASALGSMNVAGIGSDFGITRAGSAGTSLVGSVFACATPTELHVVLPGSGLTRMGAAGA
jgi:hypothetical protein